mmetsp:Transcript_12996/g.29490  ORF Transcript_12996/g.29490 Transcript_12996/m.29490 type:complete len:206 (+) Transcript_12996:91-708(+)
MYSLRVINNNYADFAGDRSAFVVVGHPEFQLGKVGTEQGLDRAWDQRKVRSHPARNIARARSAQHLLVDLHTTARSTASKPLRSKSVVGTSNLRDNFDVFAEELMAAEHVKFRSQAVTTGYANYMGTSGVCLHKARLQDDLSELRERMLKEPQATKRFLLAGDSWKYYAEELQKAKADEARQRRAFPKTVALHKEKDAEPWTLTR